MHVLSQKWVNIFLKWYLIFFLIFSDKLGKLMKNKNKPGLFAKKPGKGGGGSNCDCPCREYWTTRCAVEYKTECKQLYTHRDCKKVPVKKPMRVRETECQKCVKFFETVMETKSVR